MTRLEPYLPKIHGSARVDDRRVLSGIIFVNRNGLRWRDAPREYGPAKTRYNRWKRWSDKGVFIRMLEGLAQPQSADRKTIMIDATCLKAHRTSSSRGVKKGSINTKLHAASDADGRPISFLMSAGQVSDYTGAAALLDTLPKARWCWVIEDMMPTGSEVPCRKRGSPPASLAVKIQ